MQDYFALKLKALNHVECLKDSTTLKTFFLKKLQTH